MGFARPRSAPNGHKKPKLRHKAGIEVCMHVRASPSVPPVLAPFRAEGRCALMYDYTVIPHLTNCNKATRNATCIHVNKDACLCPKTLSLSLSLSHTHRVRKRTQLRTDTEENTGH